MSRKKSKSRDDSFTENENNAVEKLFKTLYNQPIHYQFRGSVRFMKKNIKKKSIIALSPHFIGIFVPKLDNDYELLKVNGVSGLIHILYIHSIYLSTENNFIYFVVQLNGKEYFHFLIKGNKTPRFCQLLYRNIKFTFSRYEIDIISDKKDDLLPEIKFESDNPDFNRNTNGEHENIVVSPSQKFQFAYFANCTFSNDKDLFNQEIVRFLHSLIINYNPIIDISQLYLKLSSDTSYEHYLLPIFNALSQLDLFSGIIARNILGPNILELTFNLSDDDPTKSDNLTELIQNLRMVDFESCNARSGLKAFSDAIDETNKLKVEYWNLSGNTELNFMYFPNIISKSTCPIKYINLGYCKIKPSISAQIFKALSMSKNIHKLQFLIYPGNDPFDSECKSSFESLIDAISKGNSELKYVDFSYMTIKDFSTVIQKISSLPIETLIIKGFKMDKGSSSLKDLLAFISNSTSLKKLDLSDIKIDENTYNNLSEIIKCIDKNPNLFEFELCLNNLELHDHNIVNLFKLFLTNHQTDIKKGQKMISSKWKSLSFNSNGLDSNDLANLVPLLKQIKGLEELSFNDNFNDSMLDIEHFLTSLLNISPRTKSSKNSLNLKKFSIAGTPGKRKIDEGKFLRSSLSNILINMDNVACSQLKYLDISCNHAGDSIVGPIKRLLHSKEVHIETLLFDENYIYSISLLDDLAEAAYDCNSLITFPFPINDAKYIIKQADLPEKQHVINELSGIQIKFIKAVNQHRRELKIKDFFLFPADSSVKELVENIINEERNEKKQGSKQYLRHHTRFCYEFNLSLPFQRMTFPGYKYDDDLMDIGNTNIKDMCVYERRLDDDPSYKGSDDYVGFSEELLSTFYIEQYQGTYYITNGSILTNSFDVNKDEGTKSDDKIGLNSNSNDQNVKSDNSDEDEKIKSKKGKSSNKKEVRIKKYNSDSEEEQYSEEEYKKSKKIKDSTKISKNVRHKKHYSDSEEEQYSEEEYKKSKKIKDSTKISKNVRHKKHYSDSESSSDDKEIVKSKGFKSKNDKKTSSRGRKIKDSSETDENDDLPRNLKNKKRVSCDVAFLIDSTESNDNIFQSIKDKCNEIIFNFPNCFKTFLIKYACICYRDPVDCKTDIHEVFNFNKDGNEILEFLENIKPYGGGDGPEDYVGALSNAFEKLSWNDKYKIIIWIADGPAHGKRFCGLQNHQEEESKLLPLIKKLASDEYYFIGIYCNERTLKTFEEMKNIYEQNGGKYFKIYPFIEEKNLKLIPKDLADWINKYPHKV